MDLSIIIVNWNVKDLLGRCLESIYNNVRDLEFEVIVVDNDSRDGSAELVKSAFPRVRLIANQDNAGFCRGNNQGIAIATGRYIVLLNPDTEVYEGSMETLARHLDEHSDVGAVGPMLMVQDGKQGRNGTRFTSPQFEISSLMGLYKRNPQKYDYEAYGRDDFTKQAEVDVICGACLMTRCEIVDKIGGLDESFFMYYEEVDFCRRVKKAGWRVFYVPEARVYHHWMQSAKQDSIAANRRLFRSQYLYFRKHYGLLPALAVGLFGYSTVIFRTARILAVRARDRILKTANRRAVP